MPKEEFYAMTKVQGDNPDLVVRWGDDQPRVTLNDVEYDRSGLNRLIRTLKRARDATFGIDE